MRESAIERVFCARVAQLGLIQRKVVWIGRRGAPDRVVMLPEGRVEWVELKAPGGRLSPAQAREHLRLCEVGQTITIINTIEGARAWGPR